jgi:polyferredoxin
LTHNAIQRLLLKRFALAAGTYALALVLLWLAFFTGHYEESLSGVAIGSALVVISQATLFALFYSGLNLRFADPSLTEAQVLLGLGWQTWLIAHLGMPVGRFWFSTC